MILDKIYSYKLKEVAENKRLAPVETLKEKCTVPLKTIKFSEAIKKSNGIRFIAEVKKASPSAGIIRKDFNYINIAMEYEASGASAISVLTDKEFFMGDLKYLTEIKDTIGVPVLRKDFIIDSYQVYEARAAGADSILLIARLLTKEQIDVFLLLSHDLGMQCLVEIHDSSELKEVLETGAEIIGINNRNLDTFETNLETTLRLCPLIPKGKIIVSESGIKSRADVLKLEEAGIDAILIGETLMRSDDVYLKIKELLGSGLSC
ncbi:MAG: indole-3-glycerol phosphate synthase TrpC [Candidatus Scalinduaceae bacterium]